MNEQNTITVFGGTGFIGRHIIYALAKTGATIRVATRVRQRAYFLRPAGTVGQIVPVYCNIHDDASVEAALQGSSHAVNLIGILFERNRRNNFQKLHATAAERIARICKKQNLQLLVHISALGASLEGPARYARTKAEGENKIVHGFSRAVILRPGLVFGPEDEFFNRFARMARVSPFLPLIGGGKTKFQPVYVGDIAQAVLNILSDNNPEKFYGHIFELGGPKVYSFREMMELMLRVTEQKENLLYVPTPLAKLLGFFAGLLPQPMLTVDQVRNLSRDNVVASGSPGLVKLGVSPTSLESILPTYLVQYRKGGRFSDKKRAY